MNKEDFRIAMFLLTIAALLTALLLYFMLRDEADRKTLRERGFIQVIYHSQEVWVQAKDAPFLIERLGE